MRTLIFLLLLCIPTLCYAWSLHYLVTDRALEPLHAELEKSIPVEPLDVFIANQSTDLTKLFNQYYDWLNQSGSKRFHRIPFDDKHPTLLNFLRSARLNPKAYFPLVNRILPGNHATYRTVPFEHISPLESGHEPFQFLFEDVTGKQVSAQSILVTFADEPDWQIDYNLWEISEYGYGTKPYGQETGISSKAAFHVQFLHENFLIRFFAPEMLDGMVLERIELFSRLAQLAFKTAHPYWGYRFTAWAFHYIQDSAQPYHAKAVPFDSLWYYLKFIFSLHRDKIKEETTQLVKNRHFLYEDFVAYSLEQSYLSPEFKPLASHLSQSDSIKVKNISDLLLKTTESAAVHSKFIDQAVHQTFGEKYTADSTYDLETDSHYTISKLVPSLSDSKKSLILKETQKDFENTGRATRSLFFLIKNSSVNVPNI